MAEGTGAATAGSPSATQTTPGGTKDWQAESARLQAEVAARDQQLRALTPKLHAWEKIGKDLEGVVEYDAYGNPVRLNTDDRGAGAAGPAPANGTHPLVAAGLTDAASAAALDAYYRSQLGGQYVTPAQLQAMVNQAEQRAVAAAGGWITTLRTIDRTIHEERYKDLQNFDSDLSKKTREVLVRNQGWGVVPEGARSWEDLQYGAPQAIAVAAQIAKAELFESTQATQQATAQAAQAQSAAGLASAGGGVTVPPLASAELMKLTDDEFDKKMREDMERRATQGSAV